MYLQSTYSFNFNSIFVNLFVTLGTLCFLKLLYHWFALTNTQNGNSIGYLSKRLLGALIKDMQAKTVSTELNKITAPKEEYLAKHHHFLEDKRVAETATIMHPFSQIPMWEPSDSLKISDWSLIFANFRTGVTSTISFFCFLSFGRLSVTNIFGTLSASRTQTSPWRGKANKFIRKKENNVSTCRPQLQARSYHFHVYGVFAYHKNLRKTRCMRLDKKVRTDTIQLRNRKHEANLAPLKKLSNLQQDSLSSGIQMALIKVPIPISHVCLVCAKNERWYSNGFIFYCIAGYAKIRGNSSFLLFRNFWVMPKSVMEVLTCQPSPTIHHSPYHHHKHSGVPLGKHALGTQ